MSDWPTTQSGKRAAVLAAVSFACLACTLSLAVGGNGGRVAFAFQVMAVATGIASLVSALVARSRGERSTASTLILGVGAVLAILLVAYLAAVLVFVFVVFAANS